MGEITPAARPNRSQSVTMSFESGNPNFSFTTVLEGAVQIRTCPYLDNVVEQEHRGIKARVASMLGFKRFFNARRVVAGVELVQRNIDGQFDVSEGFGNDPFAIWHNVLAA
jgi:transposase-like protein